MKIILLHPQLKNKISGEFKVSRQAVDMSLKFVFNSDNAKLIRQRAKELLIEEVNQIDISEKELTQEPN